jgi:hypothetical protein
MGVSTRLGRDANTQDIMNCEGNMGWDTEGLSEMSRQRRHAKSRPVTNCQQQSRTRHILLSHYIHSTFSISGHSPPHSPSPNTLSFGFTWFLRGFLHGFMSPDHTSVCPPPFSVCFPPVSRQLARAKEHSSHWLKSPQVT